MTAVPVASTAPAASPPLARAPVAAYAGTFAVGIVTGLVMLIDDADSTSSGAGVAVANMVHVVIALIVGAAVARAWLGDPSGLRTWARTPFTRRGWFRTVDALVALPAATAEVLLLAVGRRATVVRIETWRDARLGTGPHDPRRLGRTVLTDLPLRVVAFVAAIVTFQAAWRSGVQVFAAIDPDFTRDAWGGPGYLGASAAHWMDGVLLFAGSRVLIGLIARRRRRVRSSSL